jgi:uncharacterized repeat protein (TIGR04138 family)
VSSTLVARSDPFAQLLAEDRRYRYEAYAFVEAGLAYAQEVLGLGRVATLHGRTVRRDDGRPVRHISGQELCWALRDLAHRQYGLLAKLVLESWGVYSTSDFGEIVYNLIRVGILSKSDGDRRSDFDNVYDFHQALLRDYAIRQE